jgi:hypothetical protein
MSEIIYHELGRIKLAVLSGPTIAHEVANGLPTAAVIASPDQKIRSFLQNIFMTDRFRVYTNDDIVGVELAKDDGFVLPLQNDLFFVDDQVCCKGSRHALVVLPIEYELRCAGGILGGQEADQIDLGKDDLVFFVLVELILVEDAFDN